MTDDPDDTAPAQGVQPLGTSPGSSPAVVPPAAAPAWGSEPLTPDGLRDPVALRSPATLPPAPDWAATAPPEPLAVPPAAGVTTPIASSEQAMRVADAVQRSAMAQSDALARNAMAVSDALEAQRQAQAQMSASEAAGAQATASVADSSASVAGAEANSRPNPAAPDDPLAPPHP